jgi:putative DNA primase/helicase
MKGLGVSVAEVARQWQAAGVSCVPILANGTKRPAYRWSQFQLEVPSPDLIDAWWGGSGERYGLALICGAVSGNLELTEIEGRALQGPGALTDIINRMDEADAGGIWDLLTGPDGYAEDSPSGGMHLLYRIIDHEVPGNTKIAQDAPKEAPGGGIIRECLAETRGEGGYVIVAPTPGECHPSGHPWMLVNGQHGRLPEITWDQRNRLHAALKTALDRTPPPLPVVIPARVPMANYDTAMMSPGDDFEAKTDWLKILMPHGWQVASGNSITGTREWVRPGKNPHEGISATTGRANDRDRLYVFSTSTIFEAEVPYTKFGAFALLNHGGDHARAAQALARAGFGDRRHVATVSDVADFVPTADSQGTIEEKHYSLDDVGNGMRLVEAIRGRWRYVHEEKTWYEWRDAWVPDFTGGITREWVKVTESMLEEAAQMDPEKATVFRKWITKSRNRERINAAIAAARDFGLSHSSLEWAPERHLVNLRNGVLDLKTEVLHKHAPEFLMTKTLGTSYLPEAQCPRFEKFMADAIPNDNMRAYIQRALGYSLLGDADQRSIFLIHGPSGTGKSTLIDTMREVFGEYGTTAGAGAFRASRNEQGPNADLHALRGKRFVTTSETAENASFDEDLLKRLSGRDRVTSRGLYEKSIEWVPECTLWIATNNPPKFNSDDDAIWRRTKLIPFTTVFRGEGEISDFARKMLYPEAAGILNWLLAGLRDFLAQGLQEPDEILAQAVEQRHDSDSVARFLDDKILDGVLVEGEGYQIPCGELFAMYQEWARSVGERGLGNRRFSLRVQSIRGTERVRLAGREFWPNVGRYLGTFLNG